MTNTQGMTKEQMMARIAELEAQANRPRKLFFKVGDKGGVSVYGLNVKFPVTLYREQWERLFEAIPALKAFILEHASELATKPEKHTN